MARIRRLFFGLVILYFNQCQILVSAEDASSVAHRSSDDRHNDRQDQIVHTKAALRAHSPSNTRERIIDIEALQGIADDGADVRAKQFLYHPPGHEANKMDYPFFAHWSHAMCGAAVVHDDILLTAGHCGRKAEEPFWRKQVRLLSKYRQAGGITRNIAHLEIHPGFNLNVQEFDYQLIKLDRSVLIDTKQQPTGVTIVEMNHDNDYPPQGEPIQAVGFGTVTPDGSTGNSQVLMDATLQSFTNDHCAEQYGPGKIVDDIMLCVGSVDGLQDTCQGTFRSLV